MYMSKRHADVEAEFLKLPAQCRIPTVYIAMCKIGKIRDVAVKGRLSAIKLFKAELLEPPPEVTKKKKPARAPEPEEKPKKKRAWDENYEPAAEEDDEEGEEVAIEDEIDG